MAQKFRGTMEELQVVLEVANFRGTWKEESTGKHVFRSDSGGVLNWWPKSGTITCQGDAGDKARLEAAAMASPNEVGPRAPERSARSIFIVHGHDTESRDQLELALRRLGLEPFVLMNTSGGGMTIIEALEGTIGRDHSSDFGIVLMTPDDFGYSKADGSEAKEPRARQNVILETGMLLSSLTRQRMAILVKGHVDVPSDLQGVIHIPYNDHVRDVIPKLCERLEAAGFEIGRDKMSAAIV